MEIEIKKQIKKPLFSREEIFATLREIKTPSAVEVKNALAEKLGKSAEEIAVKKINQKFGQNEAEIEAYIYENADALKKFEPAKKEKKEKQEAKTEGGEKK